MLTDRYELPSTASPAARDAYVQGCEAKLTMYPGAIEGSSLDGVSWVPALLRTGLARGR
jgi:hypothetical protein